MIRVGSEARARMAQFRSPMSRAPPAAGRSRPQCSGHRARASIRPRCARDRRRHARSKREIPHYYLTQTVDLRRALAWLESANLDRPPAERLLPVVLLLKATALALRKLPELNGFWQKDAFLPGAGIHVGWAISHRGGGLIAPAIHNADQKSLGELMAALRDLVQRARTGGLRSSELTDPTITVTSLGERGAETVIGGIYPPQVAIVGFGRIVERPWAVDGALAVRPVVSPSLAADHRAPRRPPWRRSAGRAQDGPGHAWRHRAGGGPCHARPGQGLREELDIDSMDFLNFVIALHETLGIDIPEAEYPRLVTLDGAVAYLCVKFAVA